MPLLYCILNIVALFRRPCGWCCAFPGAKEASVLFGLHVPSLSVDPFPLGMAKNRAESNQQQEIPFPEQDELNAEMRLVDDGETLSLQLCQTQGSRTATLPGNAFVDLNFEDIWRHLETSLLTRKLNSLAPHLWLVATQSSSSITALHKQKVLGREIIVTDTADLHLVWYHSKIFIKPLPRYLLSRAFWGYVFADRHFPTRENRSKQLHAATLGFMRTYCHLIRSEADFYLAKGHGLIPENIDAGSFARFIKNFSVILDAQVSPRFHFGELRLTRLNLWSAMLLRQTHYFNISRQYDTYFSRFFQPLLFAFGTFSVLLSAMQVALSTGDAWDREQPGWATFMSVSKWTSIVTIILVLTSVMSLLGMLVFKLLSELFYALGSVITRQLYSRRNANMV